MPEQTPVPTPPPGTPSANPTDAEPADGNGNPPAAEKQPPWGKPENFNADKAWELIENLRKEKGSSGDSSALQAKVQQMEQAMEQQRNALATMLGVKPEETSDAEKLAEQINGLQGQILASEKRALAIEFKVPETMLTATDADGLRKQATDLAEFANAAHYAAVTTAPPAPAPAFQANPGQGQGNGPLTPEALEQAEYEKYYPPTAARR